MRQLPPRLAPFVRSVWLDDGAARLHAFWAAHRRAEPGRTVLLFPGSIGNASHEGDTMAFLFSRGANVLAVDYPGYGLSPGKTSETGMRAVAGIGWRFLTGERGVRPQELLVFGRSLGGAVALELAAREPARGVVVHGAFPSVPDVAADRYPFLPVRPFCLFRFDTRRAAASVRCPVVFIHGRDDRQVPIRLGRQCYERVRSPKRFVEVPGGHRGAAWTRQPGVAAALEDLWAGRLGLTDA
jgi:pimeloyl-ACP methyl ester carboxylesterase